MSARAVIIATIAGLLLLPAVASAQEDDFCYRNPLAPECVDVGGEVEEPTDVGGVVTERPPAPEAETAVLGTVLERREALAVTGTETTTLALVAGGLLGAGLLLLTTSRRRRQRDGARSPSAGSA
jgi:LPXTG-motif cell wall-anchored protein